MELATTTNNPSVLQYKPKKKKIELEIASMDFIFFHFFFEATLYFVRSVTTMYEVYV